MVSSPLRHVGSELVTPMRSGYAVLIRRLVFSFIKEDVDADKHQHQRKLSDSADDRH